MMTTLLALLVLQIPGYPNGCAKCGVVAFVDAPAETVHSLPVLSGGFVVSGWGFECVSGAPADRVDVFYSTDDGKFAPVPPYFTQLGYPVPRPDVQRAYLAACPNVVRETGYHLRVYPGAIPPGTHVLVVNVWRGPYVQAFRLVAVLK